MVETKVTQPGMEGKKIDMQCAPGLGEVPTIMSPPGTKPECRHGRSHGRDLGSSRLRVDAVQTSLVTRFGRWLVQRGLVDQAVLLEFVELRRADESRPREVEKLVRQEFHHVAAPVGMGVRHPNANNQCRIIEDGRVAVAHRP
jgi:hypothetical protein